MQEGASRAEGPGANGADDKDGMRHEDLASTWIGGKYATFSMKTVAFFDAVTLRACISSWDTDVGADWREKVAQDAFLEEHYQADDVVAEFKRKLADRSARFEMVDLRGK